MPCPCGAANGMDLRQLNVSSVEMINNKIKQEFLSQVSAQEVWPELLKHRKVPLLNLPSFSDLELGTKSKRSAAACLILVAMATWS